jgi:hypothetical protein
MTSSTSNSDARLVSRWHRFRYLGWGLLIAAILLGGVDVMVFRSVYTYDLGGAGGARGGSIGQWAHIDRAFLAVDPAKIEYAIFGDSQSIDALHPDVMAAELGATPEAVFNFSVTGGKPSDNAYTYRTYIDRMPNLRKVIYVVNEHQFNNADIGIDVKFKFHAGLGERLRAMNVDNYGELLTGWALRSFGLRGEWSSLVKRYQDGKWPAAPSMYPGGIAPTTWSKPEDKSPEYAREVADRWFENWQPDGVHTEQFGRMLSDMRLGRGLDVVIVQVPRSQWFEEIVASDYAQQAADYVERIRAAAVAAGGIEFAVVDASAAGMTLDDFRDANHVSASGAQKLSKYVAEHWWK